MLDAGYSIPVGDFASTELTDAAGFATNGYSISGGLLYDVFPLLGISIQYHQHQNGFNSNALFEKLAPAYASASNNNVVLQDFRSDSWSLKGVLLGIYLPIRHTKTTYWIGVNAGYMSAVLPESQIEYYIQSRGQQVKDLIYEGRADDAAYMVQLGVKRKLWKDVLVVGKAEYLYSEQLFTNLSGIDLVSQTLFYVPDYTQYFHMVALKAGFAWQF